jgi:diguanylate cyclase (GGDEF)-like protein
MNAYQADQGNDKREMMNDEGRMQNEELASFPIPDPSSSKGSILIVDDTPTNLGLLSDLLTHQGYEVGKALNGQMALRAATTSPPPDLILLDINMPEMNGYEVCERLKADEQTREIPVIFISALDDVLDKVKAFQVGGADYITKPFKRKELIARVENQLTIARLRSSLQEQNVRLQQEIRVSEAAVRHRQKAEEEVRSSHAQLEQRVRQRTAQLEAANQELEREILERKKAQEQLLHMALHDPLTGLANRTLFIERLEAALQRTKEQPDYLFAVLFLDCDRFKVVNDSLGHLLGDQLLKSVAVRLNSCLRPVDTLARMGGDEFTILLEDIKDISDATCTAEQLQQALASPFLLNEQEVFLNVSIGIALSTPEYDQPQHLLRDADTAMYRAKELGKARYHVFDTGMHACALARLQLETDLRRALERQEFLVYYQPIVSFTRGTIAGFEALVRWQHPERGWISPGEFIPVAEETGLIEPLGAWVLRESCRQMRLWHEQFPQREPLTISVNLSVRQFWQPNLIEQIDKILARTELDSRSLKLEITESAIVDNDASATAILQQLKSRHIQLSIDDFGTGYSSLSYLHRFPVDVLKIDRSFVSRIGETGENQEIVRAIVTLAHNLEMSAIAEGVETAQQCTYLRGMGCEFGQGYFFSKPLDSQSAEAMLATAPHW